MFKPDYERDGVTLYCGDCMEIMPHLGKVDAVVTDPPYGINFKYESHDDNPELYKEFMINIISLTQQLCPSGPQVFWQGMKNADKWHEWFPSGYRIFAACKGFVQFRPTSIQYSWDPVIFWGNIDLDPSVYRKDYSIQRMAPFGSGREKINHPCPRPLEQTTEIVETFTLFNNCILDPFMGSGTTCLSCLRLGRRFIGIEKEPKYFETAAKRIEKAFDDIALFEGLEPAPEYEQGSLLIDH